MEASRALTLDDIFELEQVLDAQISPDGSMVAFVVARQYTVDRRKLADSSVWLAPFDGSAPPRRISHGPRADYAPRWRPDGRALALLSDRERQDVAQVYVLPLDGGDAQRLTDAQDGVTGFAWSPDGARVAFLAAEPKTKDQQRRIGEGRDEIYVDHDYVFTRLWLVDAAGGAARAVTPNEYQIRSFAWLGDGWAVQASDTPDAGDFVGWRLLRVAEGRPDELLWRARYGAYPLAGSPDGRAVAWIHQGSDANGSLDDLWALRDGGAPALITSDYGGAMAWCGWLTDEELLVTAVDGSGTRLGRVATAGGAVTDIISDVVLAEANSQPPCASASRDGRRIACVTESGTRPKEVWAGELDGTLRAIGVRNQHLAGVRQGATRTVRWRAADGLEIEGVLIEPANPTPGQPAPLVVHIHGGPNWQWLDRHMASWHDWGQWLAARGYAVLLPNPRGSTGRGREYAYRNRRAWGEGDFGDVLAGVDHLVAEGVADPQRLGIGGWSYGGFLTAWAIGHSERFKAAVVGAGVTNLLSFQAADIPSWLPREQMLAAPYDDPEIYLRCSPISAAGHMATPTLVLHGAADERVRLGQGRELYHALRARGVPAEMVVYPREGHGVTELHHQRDILERVAAWFDRWLAAP